MKTQTIIRQVASKHGVPEKLITGYNREAHIVAARFEAWRIARKLGWSLPRIGREFKRDHTTIMNGLRK